MSAKNAIWRDITLHATRSVLKIIDIFIEKNIPKTLLQIFIDEAVFSIEIRKKSILLKVDGEETSQENFLEQIDIYTYSAKIVCYSILQLHKTTPTIYTGLFIKPIIPLIENILTDDHIQIEICKNQTFTIMDIIKTGIYFNFNSTTHYIGDVYDDFGNIDDVLLDFTLQEMMPIIDENFVTKSQRRLTDTSMRIAKITEPFVEISSKIGLTTRKCLMNLITPNDFYMINDYRYNMTSEAIDDRNAYDNTDKRRFCHELIEFAWHPSRFQNWCLDEEEKVRIESYRQS
jgi:hypothetical protein